jgi:hypothetical protein
MALSFPAGLMKGQTLQLIDYAHGLQMASRLAVELETGRRWVAALALARAEEARAQGQQLLPPVTEPTASPSPKVQSQQQQQQSSPSPPPSSRSTTQIFVSLDDVYLCLVNNALGVPIAYAALLGTDFRLQQQQQEGAQPGSSLDLSASVSLRAGALRGL